MSEQPKNLVVFDLETTGVRSNRDEILQISAIDGTGHQLINTYVKPTHTASWPGAERVNHISPEMVSSSPTMDELAPVVQPIFDAAALLVGYNQSFDVSFLEAAGVHINPQVEQFDVMRAFAPIFGQWDDYHSDYKWQKLTTCAEHYGFNFAAHDSLEDVKATLFCYCKITGRPIPPTLDEGQKAPAASQSLSAAIADLVSDIKRPSPSPSSPMRY